MPIYCFICDKPILDSSFSHPCPAEKRGHTFALQHGHHYSVHYSCGAELGRTCEQRLRTLKMADMVAQG